MTKLTTATRLANKFAFNLDFLRDRFAIGNLRLADTCLNFELSHETINNNLQVKLTHTGEDRLSGFLIGPDPERRIFTCKFL